MNLHLKLRRNRKGIGTVFAMVFFLLIVMVVFASFMIILNQNTGLEQTTIQAKQLDSDRYTELTTVSIANPEVATLNNVVYISCSITNNGTLPAELVRLWIKDITNQTVGNKIMTPSIVLQPGSSTQYFNSANVANVSSFDQFSFWFITTRGNTISAYPGTNQFSGIAQNGTFPGVTAINSTYATDQTPLQLSLTTTKPNQLIYVVVSYDDGNTLYTPTSTPSLTWTLRGTSSSTDHYSMGDSILKTFYAIKPSSGPLTINIQSSADELNDYYCSALTFAISGVNTTSPFDGLAQTAIGQSTMPQDTITTQYSNDLVIGALGIDSLNPLITPGAGFAEIMPVQSSYGASGEPYSMPRSVWSEWSIIQAPTTNLRVNCTFTSTKAWAIIVDAVNLVVIPSVSPVSLFPTSGPIGQPVTVSGQGFAANSRLIATFDGSQIPFSFTTDGSGKIPSGATFIVPQGSSAGNKTVTIIDSSFNYASATFTVTTSNITVNPTSGPVGTNVTVTGSNFIDNSTITLNFDGNPIATNPSPVTANATGWFSATFNFNFNDTAGVKQVLASDGVNSASATFTVTPSITLSPTNGPIGSSVNVTGSGFAASQPVIVTFAGSTVATTPVSFSTNGFGFFNASFTIPTGQTAGGKTVNATDASSNAANATFTVTPSISLSPTSGNVGSTVTVSGSGFAANSALTAKFAGSTVIISGTTSTNSSGSFTGANFTVPTWAPTWATGSVQMVIITDATSNSSSNTYTVNTVSQSITVTMSNSAPSTTVIVNGGNPNPNTFAADGSSHTITIFAGASFTLSFSNSGNTRDGFIVSSAFSATSSSYTASFNSISVTAYEQVQNTFSVTNSGGNPPSGDTLVLTGTFLASPANILSLNVGGLSSASNTAWSDYNTAVTFPASTTKSSASERWSINGAISTAPLMAGGNTFSQTYYHQYQQTLSYTVVGVGSPTAPTATGTAFGVAYAPSLTNTATPYWFDASGSIPFSTSTVGAGEQWAPIPASISATSAHTQIVSMYHQYLVTFAQSGLDSSTASGTVLTVNGTNVAYSGLPYTVWVNSGDRLVYAYNATVASTTAGKQFVVGTVSPVSPLVGISSPQTVTGSYTTQYKLTFAQSGLDNTATGTVVTVNSAAQTYSNLPYTTGWINSGSTVTYSYNNPVTSSTTGKQFRLNSVTGSASPITVSSPATITGNYVVQWQVTFQQSGLSSDATGTVLTVGANTYSYGQLPQTGVWVDDGTTFSYASTVAVSGGTKQYAWTSNTGGLTSPVNAPGTVTGNYKIQYRVTFAVSPSGSGTTSPSGTNVWEDAGSLPISATANSGYHFSSWSATTGITITSQTSATIGAAGTITANFNLNIGIDGSDTDYNTNSLSLTLTTSNANDILYLSVVENSAQSVTGVTSSGLTWIHRGTATYSAGQVKVETWYAIRATAGTTSISVALSGSPTNYADAGVVFGIKGADTANPFDVNYVTNTGTGTSPSASITTANNNDLILASIAVSGGTPSVSAGSNFNLIATGAYSGYRETSDEYRIVSATNTYSAGFSLGSSNSWAMIVDAIKQIS